MAALLGTPLQGNEVVECAQAYIGNRRTRELHDPQHAQANCQLSEILDPWPFEDPADALREGYDGCAWCMPALHTG